MTERDLRSSTRRSLLTGLGGAALGAGAMSIARADQHTGFQPQRHEEDAWYDEMPGTHRAWVDTSFAEGGMEGLHYARNILEGHKMAYDGSYSDYAMIVCWRSYSTVLGYKDPIWARYGEIIADETGLKDPRNGRPYTVNPVTLPDRLDLPNFGATLEVALERGIKFALCNAATTYFADVFARETDGSAKEIHADLVLNAVPESRFVATGVLATTRAQEFGYSLLYSA